MAEDQPASSARRDELLDAAYGYVLRHGLAEMSLRPLAAAVGSSPRVLLYLFGSKDELIRELLARARVEELQLLARSAPASATDRMPLVAVAEQLWTWLSAPQHRSLLVLWVEAYARSLVDPGGPWQHFAAASVQDWLEVLDAADPAPSANGPDPTTVLALLRGAMLDLLATGDLSRTTAAVRRQLRRWETRTPPTSDHGDPDSNCGAVRRKE